MNNHQVLLFNIWKELSEYLKQKDIDLWKGTNRKASIFTSVFSNFDTEKYTTFKSYLGKIQYFFTEVLKNQEVQHILEKFDEKTRKRINDFCDTGEWYTLSNDSFDDLFIKPLDPKEYEEFVTEHRKILWEQRAKDNIWYEDARTRMADFIDQVLLSWTVWEPQEKTDNSWLVIQSNGRILLDDINITGNIKQWSRWYKLFEILHKNIDRKVTYGEIMNYLWKSVISKNEADYLSDIKSKLPKELKNLIEPVNGWYIIYKK